MVALVTYTSAKWPCTTSVKNSKSPGAGAERLWAVRQTGATRWGSTSPQPSRTAALSPALLADVLTGTAAAAMWNHSRVSFGLLLRVWVRVCAYIIIVMSRTQCECAWLLPAAKEGESVVLITMIISKHTPVLHTLHVELCCIWNGVN